MCLVPNLVNLLGQNSKNYLLSSLSFKTTMNQPYTSSSERHADVLISHIKSELIKFKNRSL